MLFGVSSEPLRRGDVAIGSIHSMLVKERIADEGPSAGLATHRDWLVCSTLHGWEYSLGLT